MTEPNTQKEREQVHAAMTSEWKKYLKTNRKTGVLDIIPAQIWADAFVLGYRCRLQQEAKKSKKSKKVGKQ